MTSNGLGSSNMGDLNKLRQEEVSNLIIIYTAENFHIIEEVSDSKPGRFQIFITPQNT
jgi:hypothetical protein